MCAAIEASVFKLVMRGSVALSSSFSSSSCVLRSFLHIEKFFV